LVKVEVWVFGDGFLGGCTPKKPTGFFWVRTRVSEPCTEKKSVLQAMIFVYNTETTGLEVKRSWLWCHNVVL